MSETTTSQEIRAAVGRLSTTLIFRNNVGALRDLAGRIVHFGLFPGSGDLIAIESVTITPDMVGTVIGVFCSVEVKKTGRDTTDPKRKEAQRLWRHMVNARGGRAGVARTPDEAIRIIEGRATDEQKA